MHYHTVYRYHVCVCVCVRVRTSTSTMSKSAYRTRPNNIMPRWLISKLNVHVRRNIMCTASQTTYDEGGGGGWNGWGVSIDGRGLTLFGELLFRE